MQRAFTAIKEHSSVAYAKVATIGGFCDPNLIIVKATSPDDLPPPERYVNELLKIFSISPSSFRSFSLGFTRRFSKTKCWRVALKCLILLHRLLRSLPEHSPFRTELLQTRSNGTLSLCPCQFRDSSSSSYSEDYTFFIRSYAQLLDEALVCFSLDEGEEKYYDVKEEEEEEEPKNFQEKMNELGRLLELLPQLQNLIDRVMGCKPSGSAAQNLLVRTATRLAIRESFVFYTSFRKEVVVVLENLLQMPHRNCVAAFGIYKKASIQASQLSHFYEWCKFMELCGPFESPVIDQIPEIQVQALETFLNGMWQLTDIESSYSSSSSSITTTESPQTSLLDSSSSTSTEDDSEKQERRLEVVVSNQWVKFEESPLPENSETCDQEMGPLIQLDEDDEAIINIDDSWEAILEASIGSQSFAHSANNLFFNPNIGHGHGWEMQVYNPRALNPFHQPHNVPLCSDK